MDELGPTTENIEFKVRRVDVMRPCIERCGHENMIHIWMRCGERRTKQKMQPDPGASHGLEKAAHKGLRG